MMMILTATRWNAFLACACLTKSCGLLPHNPPWESFFFGASSHNHDHHVDCSPIIHHGRASSSAHLHISMITIWMARLKQRISSRWLILNLHFISSFFIMLMSWSNLRAHFIFIFKTYLTLDILHQFLLIATLKPTYGSRIAYGQLLQI